MKKQQSGFTLIELIAVIVILGILAAVAVPRFVDLSAEAEAAAIKGAIGAVESGSAMNYAACLAGNAACAAIAEDDACGAAIDSVVTQLDATQFPILGTVAADGTGCTVAGEPVQLLITP